MSNVYTLILPDGSTRLITERTIRNIGGLTLHGRGRVLYGGERDQNQIFLASNFAGNTPPAGSPGPLIGQTWYNTNTNELNVFDGAVWNPVGSGATANIPGAGTGIILAGSPLLYSVDEGAVNHDNLLGFVANEHINHSSVVLTAGTGLSGGGDITASRTFNVGAGDGIAVNANDVAVDSTVVRTSGTQTIAGDKTFTGNVDFTQPVEFANGTVGDPSIAFSSATDTGFYLSGNDLAVAVNGSQTLLLSEGPDQVYFPVGTAANPSISFIADTDTGMYRSASNELSFATGGIQRFRIEPNGVLRSLNSAYEVLVTDDDDIPNKKYVDDAISVTGVDLPTFSGTSNITGLDSTKKYLVSVYGTTRNAGSGTATLGGVRVGTGTTAGGGSTLANTGSQSIDWFDGNAPQSQTFVVSPNTTSINGAVDWRNTSDFEPATSMYAVEIGNSVPLIAGVVTLNDVTAPNFYGICGSSLSGLGSVTIELTFQPDGDLVISGSGTNPVVPDLIGGALAGPAVNEWLTLAGSPPISGQYTVQASIIAEGNSLFTNIPLTEQTVNINRTYSVTATDSVLSNFAEINFVIREDVSGVERANAIIRLQARWNGTASCLL